MGGSRDCHLLHQKVDTRCACGQTAHAHARHMGSTGRKNSWQLSLANVAAVATHCLIDMLMEIVTRFLMLVRVVRSHQSSCSLCSSTCGLSLA
eukprot:12008675-Ditylum_brightwellii.AAC.1